MQSRGGPKKTLRRGMSLMEAVLAAALLGIFSSVLLSAVNSAWREQLHHRHLIGASELANRLFIIYLDDRTELPPRYQPLAYGPPDSPFMYRWERIERAITIEDPESLSPEAARQRREMRRGSRPEERFRSVTFRVWLCEQDSSGRGAYEPTASTPQATLTRVIDPIYSRNPDSTRKILANPALQSELYGDLLGPAPIGEPAPRQPRGPSR